MITAAAWATLLFQPDAGPVSRLIYGIVAAVWLVLAIGWWRQAAREDSAIRDEEQRERASTR